MGEGSLGGLWTAQPQNLLTPRSLAGGAPSKLRMGGADGSLARIRTGPWLKRQINLGGVGQGCP
jgi:hypothetical protein